jgi:hypothetical protein
MYLLDYFLFLEEDEKEEYKIEAFKSTILQSFPSKKLYEALYTEKKEEDGPWIHKAPESAEEVQDLMQILRSVQWANDEEVPSVNE